MTLKYIYDDGNTHGNHNRAHMFMYVNLNKYKVIFSFMGEW